jgi:hypothetical protein
LTNRSTLEYASAPEWLGRFKVFTWAGLWSSA